MEMLILSNGTIIEYAVSSNNCRIKDSYLIKSKKEKYEFLNLFVRRHPEFAARSIKSYYREWKAHNILYKLHIKRSSTRDTDLNINEHMILRIGYFIIAALSIDR